MSLHATCCRCSVQLYVAFMNKEIIVSADTMRSVMASSQVVVSLQDSVTHISASITAVVMSARCRLLPESV